jgi:hypothetical protein
VQQVLRRSVLQPATPSDPQAWTRLAAAQFDRACRLMPERTNEAIAVRLGELLDEHITRWAISSWRRGMTPVRHRTLLAACHAADINVLLELREPNR